MNRRILIAMSGGVDSSVAAWLLKQAGWECRGAVMRLLPNGAQQGVEDAGQVAALLGMPFEVLPFQEEFRKDVLEQFVRTYQAGWTPNPCVDCNRCLKFGRFLEAAEERGLDSIATGHYARTEYDRTRGRWVLKKALDLPKDQSYFLYALSQYQLERVQFPLGGLTKQQVREIAEQQGFVNARKHDSQDICFVPDGDYAGFIQAYTGSPLVPGDFLDLAGQTVGQHRGAVCYTLGQRKGLGLAMGAPVYVCGKDMSANTVTVGPEEALFSRRVLVEGLNWIAIEHLTEPLRVKAKLRSRQTEQWAVIQPEGNGVLAVFDEPQRAVTPGQAAVFYDGDTVIGGGTITAAEDN